MPSPHRITATRVRCWRLPCHRLTQCVMNHRTAIADMDVLLDDLRRVAAALGPGPEFAATSLQLDQPAP